MFHSSPQHELASHPTEPHASPREFVTHVPQSTDESDSLEEEFFELVRKWHKLPPGVKGAILTLARREQ